MDLKQQQKNNNNILCKHPKQSNIIFFTILLLVFKILLILFLPGCWVEENSCCERSICVSSVDFVLFCTSVVWVAVIVQKKALLVCGGGNCSLPTLPNCRELSLKSLRYFHFGNCDISTLEIVLFPFLKLQYLNFQLQSLCCFYLLSKHPLYQTSNPVVDNRETNQIF